ncbi:MAG: nucleotidyltransferase family protein [Maricaulaceae bacterium]
MTSVNVLILAGQREGVVDPLCADTGEPRKALVPILGRPMLSYVVDALDAAALKEPFHISGCPASVDKRLTQAPSEAGPAGSALAALSHGMSFPVLMTTADHPLLTADMIREFIEKSQATDADFCLGLAEETIIHPAYPHVKRTYLRFADHAVSGCNLFYIANERGLAAIEFWKDAQHFRKQPLKLARKISLPLFWRYWRGKLTLDGALAYASKTLGITAAPVLMSVPEAAIDVDKPSDRILVEQILIKEAERSIKRETS